MVITTYLRLCLLWLQEIFVVTSVPNNLQEKEETKMKNYFNKLGQIPYIIVILLCI